VTKNGTAPTIHLNPDALAAIERVRLPGQKPTDRVFPRQGAESRYDTRSWFVPLLGRGEDNRVRLALQPAHILLLAGNGRGDDQRDSGTARTQDNHHVCSVFPSVARSQAIRD
jgi:hypothetical protein